MNADLTLITVISQLFRGNHSDPAERKDRRLHSQNFGVPLGRSSTFCRKYSICAIRSTKNIMDGAYEPSFEVVDRAEEAEDYLLSKTHRTGQQLPPLDDSKENYAPVPLKMDIVTSKAEEAPRKEDVAVHEDFLEKTNDYDDLKFVKEEEEGQEALWVGEAETNCSASLNSEKSRKSKPSPRRSSFLFGSKKHAALSPKRTFSLRKKKDQPQVILLGASPDPNVTTPEPISTTEAPQPPDAVPASDTISSLGFDKSFDVKSPLSMSSLNEILDAPLTPTESSDVANKSVQPIKKKRKNMIRGMFRKTNKGPKSNIRSLSLRLNRSQERNPTIIVLENVEDDEMYDPKLHGREVLATMDVNERIQMALLQAMENDDTQSLTSLTGVPVISNVEEKEEKTVPIRGQKPLNFDKIKPNFVAASKDILTLAEIQEKFVPLEDLESDEEEAPEDNTEDRENLSDSCDGEEPHPSNFNSPNSTAANSTATDRYTVAGLVTDPESDCDEGGMSDKYSVLPDPCSFCDSFYVSTSNPEAVSKTMTESPTIDVGKNDLDASMDSPVLDKYAELPEVFAVTSSGSSSSGDCIPPAMFSETTDVSSVAGEAPVPYEEPRSLPTKPSVTSKSMVTGFFSKFRRPPTKQDSIVQMDPVLPAPEYSSDAFLQRTQDAPLPKLKNAPKKSILKKKKETSVTAEAAVDATSLVPPEVKTSGAKISVVSLSNDVPSHTSTTETKEVVPPIEDPSTEGSSSAEDETNVKSDPLLVRLRKNLQQSRAHANRRGLDPQTEVDPVIVVGNGRARLDP
jgi:hypothetical protein